MKIAKYLLECTVSSHLIVSLISMPWFILLQIMDIIPSFKCLFSMEVINVLYQMSLTFRTVTSYIWFSSSQYLFLGRYNFLSVLNNRQQLEQHIIYTYFKYKFKKLPLSIITMYTKFLREYKHFIRHSESSRREIKSIYP